MNIALWIVQALLAAAFAMGGFMKLFTPMEEFVQAMPWAQDFQAYQIKGIGALEVLGALGLILPMALKRLQFLTPTAAAGLLLTMGGAAITHLNRGESIVPNIVLGLLLIFVIYGRKNLFKA